MGVPSPYFATSDQTHTIWWRGKYMVALGFLNTSPVYDIWPLAWPSFIVSPMLTHLHTPTTYHPQYIDFLHRTRIYFTLVRLPTLIFLAFYWQDCIFEVLYLLCLVKQSGWTINLAATYYLSGLFPYRHAITAAALWIFRCKDNYLLVNRKI